MTTNKIKILIADDHQLFADGIKSLLQASKDIEVLYMATNGQEALTIIENNPNAVDLILTDVSMPLLSGIDLCKAIKNKFPKIKVLIISMFNNATVVKESVLAEADGYLLKTSSKEYFFTAIHRLLEDGTYYDEKILPIIYNQFTKEKESEAQKSVLTERETEVLKLIAQEFTSNEIAEKLFISKKTVDNHRHNILEKTNSKSTIGLLKYAIKNNYV